MLEGITVIAVGIPDCIVAVMSAAPSAIPEPRDELGLDDDDCKDAGLEDGGFEDASSECVGVERLEKAVGNVEEAVCDSVDVKTEPPALRAKVGVVTKVAEALPEPESIVDAGEPWADVGTVKLMIVDCPSAAEAMMDWLCELEVEAVDSEVSRDVLLSIEAEDVEAVATAVVF